VSLESFLAMFKMPRHSFDFEEKSFLWCLFSTPQAAVTQFYSAVFLPVAMNRTPVKCAGMRDISSRSVGQHRESVIVHLPQLRNHG